MNLLSLELLHSSRIDVWILIFYLTPAVEVWRFAFSPMGICRSNPTRAEQACEWQQRQGACHRDPAFASALVGFEHHQVQGIAAHPRTHLSPTCGSARPPACGRVARPSRAFHSLPWVAAQEGQSSRHQTGGLHHLRGARQRPRTRGCRRCQSSSRSWTPPGARCKAASGSMQANRCQYPLCLTLRMSCHVLLLCSSKIGETLR